MRANYFRTNKEAEDKLVNDVLARVGLARSPSAPNLYFGSNGLPKKTQEFSQPNENAHLSYFTHLQNPLKEPRPSRLVIKKGTRTVSSHSKMRPSFPERNQGKGELLSESFGPIGINNLVRAALKRSQAVMKMSETHLARPNLEENPLSKSFYNFESKTEEYSTGLTKDWIQKSLIDPKRESWKEEFKAGKWNVDQQTEAWRSSKNQKESAEREALSTSSQIHLSNSKELISVSIPKESSNIGKLKQKLSMTPKKPQRNPINQSEKEFKGFSDASFSMKSPPNSKESSSSLKSQEIHKIGSDFPKNDKGTDHPLREETTKEKKVSVHGVPSPPRSAFQTQSSSETTQPRQELKPKEHLLERHKLYSPKKLPEKENSIIQDLAVYSGGLDRSGKYDGFGSITTNEHVQYEGFFRNGLFHGSGTQRNHEANKMVLSPLNSRSEQNKSRSSKENEHFVESDNNASGGDHSYELERLGLKEEEVVVDWAKWTKFEGNFQFGRKQGFGKMEFLDGSRFEGAFKNNLGNGIGVFVSKEGKETIGSWRNGELIARI